jgi:hypothetical protein
MNEEFFVNTRWNAVLALVSLVSLLLLPAAAHAQCEDWLQGPLSDGALTNGANGPINEFIAWDPDGDGPLLERLVAAGAFTSIGGVAALNIAQYDPSTAQWSPFGAGIPLTVFCLAVYNGRIVAGCDGGYPDAAFDRTVQFWTGTMWAMMSATSSGSVEDMIVYDGSLYIAGAFYTEYVTPTSNTAHFIARWDDALHTWEDVEEADFGSQKGSVVHSLAVYDGKLVAAGNKVSAGSTTGNAVHITHGYPGGSWTAMTDGTDPGTIRDMKVYGGELLVAGTFTELNGVTCRSLAGWNGSTFHDFQGGVSTPGITATVWSVAIHDGIVIGGDFLTAGGTNVNRVAHWPAGGSAWQALAGGIDERVYEVCTYRNEVVAGGWFANAGGPASNIAHWNGAAWAPFGGGSASYVLAMTPFAGRMVAGGSFTQPALMLGTANNIASWNGGELSAFGLGLNNAVYALETFKYTGINGSNELIAGGVFTTAGGVGALRIARWREQPISAYPPPAWEPMGAGFNFNVYAIERMGGATYAGGNFTSSGTTPVSRIARWNETTDTWESMAGGMNGTVRALKEFNGSLYAGGSFTTAGGVATGGLARWTGTGWAQVGGNFLGQVHTLEVYNGSLIIGGQFAGLANGANIARYDGVNYFNLGTGGTNSVGVRSLKTNGIRLYAGGVFTSIGGVSAENIAWWDGTAWHAASGGANGVVWALGSFYDEIHAGGEFTAVKAGVTPSLRWARYSETGLPMISVNPYPFLQTVSAGATVTFSASVGDGNPAWNYRWTHDDVLMFNGPGPDGSTVSGAATPVLKITNVRPSDAGAYRLVVTNGCGSVTSAAGTLAVEATSGTSSEARVSIFHSIGPNPSGGESTLSFSLAVDAEVRYSVFDLRGRLVRRVDLGRLSAGRFEARWDTRDDGGRNVAAGVYFVSLELGGQRLGAKRLTIVR